MCDAGRGEEGGRGREEVGERREGERREGERREGERREGERREGDGGRRGVSITSKQHGPVAITAGMDA